MYLKESHSLAILIHTSIHYLQREIRIYLFGMLQVRVKPAQLPWILYSALGEKWWADHCGHHQVCSQMTHHLQLSLLLHLSMPAFKLFTILSFLSHSVVPRPYIGSTEKRWRKYLLLEQGSSSVDLECVVLWWMLLRRFKFTRHASFYMSTNMHNFLSVSIFVFPLPCHYFVFVEAEGARSGANCFACCS